MTKFLVVENGVEIDATEEEIKEAEDAEVLYFCDECLEYHIYIGREFKGVKPL